MNSRDRQICDKILAEIAVLKELVNGIALDEFCSDE